MTQHYRGKRREQARVIAAEPHDVLVADTPTGIKSILLATADQQLTAWVLEMKHQGARRFFTASLVELADSPEVSI